MTKQSATTKKKVKAFATKYGKAAARKRLMKAGLGLSTAYSLVSENYPAELRPETCKRILKATGG